MKRKIGMVGRSIDLMDQRRTLLRSPPTRSMTRGTILVEQHPSLLCITFETSRWQMHGFAAFFGIQTLTGDKDQWKDQDQI